MVRKIVAELLGTGLLRDALGYWAAQFIGGVLGALLLWGTFSCSPLYSRSKTGLGTNGWGAASHIHISAGGAFLTEVMLTGALAAGLHRVLYPEPPVEALASGEVPV